MKPYFSKRNRKMGDTVPIGIFNLPAVSSCRGFCTPQCAELCYARKAEKAYPNVLPRRHMNWEASEQDDFVELTVGWLRRQKPALRWFRIHESGEFYSQEYVDKWARIATLCPEIRFLAFTKATRWDYSRCPDNMQIVWSIWPDTKLVDQFPLGPRAYAGEFKARRKTLECPGHCDNCMMCWNLSAINCDVHFAIH